MRFSYKNNRTRKITYPVAFIFCKNSDILLLLQADGAARNHVLHGNRIGQGGKDGIQRIVLADDAGITYSISCMDV